MRCSIPIVLAALALAGCASSYAPVPVEQVAVHESQTSIPPNYRILKRIWVDSWASAVFVPTYASTEEAARSMRQQAADLGGNAVINFACYRWIGWPRDGAFGCNGTVVRYQ
ncbi:MAG TPA: hypothetical protein VLV90_11450 [Burkholderiales bacterium]|nr:hypothetical protein [Burkholderiales bacterium]